MLRENSIGELEEILQELRSKLEVINQDRAKDKKYDYAMISQNELSQILKSKINPRKKKHLLLSRIGYARTNLFTEYFERIDQARKNNDLDNGVKLMNEYTETMTTTSPI
jgi:hypothetical protein